MIVKDVSEVRLAQLLCTRMCHDLAGPVGAVVNGAELLAGDAAFAAEASALLGESAHAASARVKFFRAALGWNGGNLSGGHAARDLLAHYIAAVASAASAPELVWDNDGAHDMASEGLQLLLNLGLLAFECLPRGGRISVTASAYLEVVAEGRGVALREGVAEALSLDGQNLTPKSVQAYYTARLAGELGGRVTLEVFPDRVALRVVGA